VRHEIRGEIAQYARLHLEPGEHAWLSRGSLVSHSPGVSWRLRVPGGLSGAARRTLSGEGMALTLVEALETSGHVLIAANAPGHIIEWDLGDGPVLATRGAFLAAWGESIEVDVSIARRTGAALFGGAGLFLQRISGIGVALVHARGDFIDLRLGEGERLIVSTGNLAAFAQEVDYDVRTVGGVRKTLFGREGLFMTDLGGPGRVLLQSLERGSGDLG
jgi:uncharacterized protein (TIGR00266 family)